MLQDDDHPVRLPSALDHEKLAEAVLGLLALTLHDGRAWKALDWDLMNLLYHKGWICDPVSKAKSVALTEEGEALAGEFLQSTSVIHRTRSSADPGWRRERSGSNKGR